MLTQINKQFILVLLIISIAFPGMAKAGFIIYEQDYTTDEPDMKTVTISKVQKNRMKFYEEDDFIYYLWDLEHKETYQVNTEAGIYSGGNFKDEIENMKKYIARLKEEMDREMERYGGDLPARPATKAERTDKELNIIKTTDSIVLAGYKSIKYEVLQNDRLIEEIWISRDIDISRELDYKEFKEMFQEWMKAVSVAISGILEVSDDQQWYDSEKYLSIFEEGYTMKQVEHNEWGAYISEVVKIEEKDIPESEFRIPEGYHKVTSEEFMESVGE